ncbi:phosphopentomutase [Thalassotalea ganghwensis]
MAKVIILVLDSFGIGAAPDAEKFGDLGANTFAHIAQDYFKKTNKLLSLPNLTKLGLVQACMAAGKEDFPIEPDKAIKGAYGYARELSSGKDTPSGHWEMAGVPVLFDWGYFTNKESSFPTELIENINVKTGYSGMLGNCHASGTEIIARLGEEHIKTGMPICYTSGDSVFQVAAHEKHFGLDNLYRYCQQVRELLADYNIGRVIARPFIGTNSEDFTRTGNRRDYSLAPPAETVLDKFTHVGGQVISVGKIADIFAHQGITDKHKATGIDALVETTIKQIKLSKDNSIIFTNLVNFDQDFGHRRDPIGYANALQGFDELLPTIYQEMSDDDLLILTADHGCDPTWPGTDHTREYVPVLAYHHNISSIDLGERKTFADIAQTIADYFDLDALKYGESFLSQIKLPK